jgi:glycosyltransferase involved in cell wall biosynthesis
VTFSTTKERLRVLQVLPSFNVGGAEVMASHLIRGLSGTHDVFAASLAPPRHSPIERQLQESHIPMWHLGKDRGFDARMFARFGRLLSEIQPDVVHTHLSVLRYTLPGSLLRRVPLAVHTLHNVAEHESDTCGRLLQWFAFRGAVLPVAISKEVAATFRRVYGRDCRATISNGIPVKSYRRGGAEGTRWRKAHAFDSDAVLFVCVGRLDTQKNPLLLLRAFAALDDTRSHLLLLGAGNLRDQVVAEVRERGLQGRVHLLGKRSDVADCLAASDVFVLASNWEGQPLAVMEAMAAGLPVVCTAVGGVPELVRSGKHGILVPPGDQVALTGAMRCLRDDPQQRAAMGAAGRNHAADAFGLEHMAEEYANLYRVCLGASAAGRFRHTEAASAGASTGR